MTVSLLWYPLYNKVVIITGQLFKIKLQEAPFTWNHSVMKDHAVPVREQLKQHFPGDWVWRTGSQEWLLKSLDFCTLDFFLWGHTWTTWSAGSCSLRGSDKWHLDESATALGDSLTSVYQSTWRTCVRCSIKWHISSWFQINRTLSNTYHITGTFLLTSRMAFSRVLDLRG